MPICSRASFFALSAAALVARCASAAEEVLHETLALDDACEGVGEGEGRCGVELRQMRGLRLHTQQERVDGERGRCDSAIGLTQIRWAKDPSYCLSADGNRAGNGVKIQLWKCDQTWSSPGQIFYQDLLAGTSKFINLDKSNYCLSVDGNRWQNGAQLQLWECDWASDSQM
mmetsp:Transcript_69511/g.226396  ORF Transcript_69511/g.226396 Transcript_69511/m.226396 type:complete len:171 (-) Transcript_69511:70-582(-)